MKNRYKSDVSEKVGKKSNITKKLSISQIGKILFFFLYRTVSFECLRELVFRSYPRLNDLLPGWGSNLYILSTNLSSYFLILSVSFHFFKPTHTCIQARTTHSQLCSNTRMHTLTHTSCTSTLTHRRKVSFKVIENFAQKRIAWHFKRRKLEVS